ncbi:MAG: holo-ACP synthase [Ardenticatenaceae bacterium]|nr:holo-ACP synthase [Ardenticatenaceae bacterium]
MITSGVDMIALERVQRAIDRHGDRFLKRIFTDREQGYCAGRLNSLAGRFAVKEAVAKALGTGIGDMDWTDIEIVTDSRGKPQLELHNQAQQMALDQGWTHWSVSLSHTETHAIGFAVATS